MSKQSKSVNLMLKLIFFAMLALIFQGTVFAGEKEAELVVVAGDIDNLGFGWPDGFDVFSGNSTPVHPYPWKPGENDPAGTDRIMLGTSYNGNPPSGQDGYTSTTKRLQNTPQAIVLNYNLKGITVRGAILQMFVDDFQAPVFQSKFHATLNEKRAYFLEEALNSLNQTGPIGKLITVKIPGDFLPEVKRGSLEVYINDPITGAGDGFAIDFARLLINPGTYKNVGKITGVVTDAATGKPLSGALISYCSLETGITANDGTYTITDVPAGLATVTVRKESFISVTNSVDLVAGKSAVLNFALTLTPKGDYKNPPVPRGFSYIDGSWDTGFTIEDANGNQFVWIPVGAITDGLKKRDWSKQHLAANETIEEIPFEITDAVNRTGGFYVAKFEASRAGNKIQSKPDQAVWNNVDWLTAKTACETMGDDYGYQDVKTHLLYDAEWDTIVQWLQQSGISIDTSTVYGNYEDNTSLKEAGLKKTGNAWAKTNNIYDLAGNAWEWTMGARIDFTGHVMRGGGFNYVGANFTISDRYDNELNASGSHVGFRPAFVLLNYNPPEIYYEDCVLSGTQITLADGSKKSIEQLLPNDVIAAWDINQKKLTTAMVEKVLVHDIGSYSLDYLKTANGTEIKITGNHPILTKETGWKYVSELNTGDTVYALDPKSGSIIETSVVAIIRNQSQSGIVYNLKTSQSDYFASDILVHNKCLQKGSLIDTPSGQYPVEELKVGDIIYGNVGGKKVPTRVTNIYTKTTILPALPGKVLSDKLTVTANHQIFANGNYVEADGLAFPSVNIQGDVYDIQTDAGNYYGDGVLMRASE